MSSLLFPYASYFIVLKLTLCAVVDIICVLLKPYRVSRHQYVNTEEFIDAVADELKARLLKAKI